MSDAYLDDFYRFWRDHKELDFDEAMAMYSDPNRQLPGVEIKIEVNTPYVMDGSIMLRVDNTGDSFRVSTLFDDLFTAETPYGYMTRTIMDKIIENLLLLQSEDNPNPKISNLITRIQQEYEALFTGGSK